MNNLNPNETKPITEIDPALSDTNANQDSDAADENKTSEAAFKVFSTKADWQAEIDRILSARLKDYKRLKEQVLQQEEFISELTEYIKSSEGIDENISDKWFGDLKDLKDKYPDIDLSGLMENEKFISHLTKGMPAEDAFKLINHDELVEAARESGKESLISNIRAKGERPLEVGTNPRNGMMVKPNPSRFSKKELEEIGNRVMRGERITL